MRHIFANIIGIAHYTRNEAGVSDRVWMLEEIVSLLP